MNGINSCIDRYYKEKNNEIIFNEYYLLEPYIAQYGYYVCKRLLDQKSEKAAARYYSLLEKKYHLARDALRKNGKKNHLFNYSTASLLEEMQKYDKASRIFESLLDEEDLKSHYHYGAYFHLGRIYHKLNKMQKSNQYLRKCLSIEPNHKMARVLMEENAKKLNSTLP